MYIFHNKELVDDKQHDFNNRAYQYGDAVFETIKYKNGKALFINDHYERLIKSMNMLKLIVPDFFSIDFFNEQFEQLTLKNNCNNSARVRLQVYRNSNGFYLPQSNQCCYSISTLHQEGINYILNEKHLSITVYSENRKSKSPLSNLKSANALLYIMAAQFAHENDCEDCYILNEDGNICEATSSNVFIFNGAQLFTPPLSDGGVDGIMRKQIISLALSLKLNCIEKSLGVDEILNAQEVILSNVIQGIKVVKCNSAFKKTLQQLVDELNVAS